MIVLGKSIKPTTETECPSTLTIENNNGMKSTQNSKLETPNTSFVSTIGKTSEEFLNQQKETPTDIKESPKVNSQVISVKSPEDKVSVFKTPQLSVPIRKDISLSQPVKSTWKPPLKRKMNYDYDEIKNTKLTVKVNDILKEKSSEIVSINPKTSQEEVTETISVPKSSYEKTVNEIVDQAVDESFKEIEDENKEELELFPEEVINNTNETSNPVRNESVSEEPTDKETIDFDFYASKLGLKLKDQSKQTNEDENIHEKINQEKNELVVNIPSENVTGSSENKKSDALADMNTEGEIGLENRANPENEERKDLTSTSCYEVGNVENDKLSLENNSIEETIVGKLVTTPKMEAVELNENNNMEMKDEETAIVVQENLTTSHKDLGTDDDSVPENETLMPGQVVQTSPKEGLPNPINDFDMDLWGETMLFDQLGDITIKDLNIEKQVNTCTNGVEATTTERVERNESPGRNIEPSVGETKSIPQMLRGGSNGIKSDENIITKTRDIARNQCNSVRTFDKTTKEKTRELHTKNLNTIFHFISSLSTRLSIGKKSYFKHCVVWQNP